MNQEKHWLYTMDEWDKPLFSALLDEAFTQPIVTVWDVGACVGAWSFLVSKRAPLKFFLFEPFKDNITYINERSELKDIYMTLLPFGLWYGASKAELSNRKDGNIGGQFIREVDKTGIPSGVFCDFKTVEELDIPKPDLVKLDVEGAEINIIEHSTLLREIPQIIVEWHYEDGPNAKDAEAFFSKHLPHKIVNQINKGMYLLRL